MKKLLKNYLEKERNFEDVEVINIIDENKTTCSIEISHKNNLSSEYIYVNIWHVLSWLNNY